MVNDSFLTGKVHLWPLGFDCIHFSRDDFPPQFFIIQILDNIQSLSIIKFIGIIYNLINFSSRLAIFPIKTNNLHSKGKIILLFMSLRKCERRKKGNFTLKSN